MVQIGSQCRLSFGSFSLTVSSYIIEYNIPCSLPPTHRNTRRACPGHNSWWCYSEVSSIPTELIRILSFEYCYKIYQKLCFYICGLTLFLFYHLTTFNAVFYLWVWKYFHIGDWKIFYNWGWFLRIRLILLHLWWSFTQWIFFTLGL